MKIQMTNERAEMITAGHCGGRRCAASRVVKPLAMTTSTRQVAAQAGRRADPAVGDGADAEQVNSDDFGK